MQNVNCKSSFSSCNNSYGRILYEYIFSNMKPTFNQLSTPTKLKGKTMQVLNIVLLHDQKPESYVDLFQRLVQEDYVIRLRGENFIELLSFKKLASWNMYEGVIVTYTGIRKNAWFNQRSKEIETHESDEDLFANTKKATFYFVPERHKLCLLSGSEITIQNIKKFVDEASLRLLGANKIHSNYITSKDEIADAYKDLNINRVRLTINYSNKDYTEGFEEAFDNLAKDDNVALINMDIVSAEDENLNMNRGGMVDSLLNLATTLGNGSADITGYQVIPPKRKGKKSKRKNLRIRTSDYIEKFRIGFNTLQGLPTAVYNEIVTRFKSDE